MSLITLVSFRKPFDEFNDDVITSALTSNPSVTAYAYGARMEDFNQVELWIQWSTPTPPDSLPLELIKACGSSESLQTYHVPFKSESSARRALGAPVTEVLICSLQPGKDLKAFEELLNKGNELHVGAAGFHDADCGFVKVGNMIEKAVIVLGWDSKEAHAAYAATGVITPIFAQYVQYINMKETIQFHVSYKRPE
ncbi:hypothetical protein VKT23_013774 [Stygiomarasmius scandens]|uniref:ABM domain-containing protein n=1 Tax=Marasmiellus scandens TaxID=2682957 RepID=A0ABR1J2V7_9AGAR